MKILIVEDITLVANRIKSLCNTAFNNPECDLAFDLTMAETYISKTFYDLIFLDINVNGSNGFDLLALSRVDSHKTIIITANQDNALKAFEFEVFDFIHKPISQNRFNRVAQRFLKIHADEISSITIKRGHRHYKISIIDIVYCKASGNYSEIFTSDGQCHLFDRPVNYFEEHFDCFFRCHRSYLTKGQCIESMTKLGAGQYRLNLVGGIQIPLSRSVYSSLNASWNFNAKNK